MDLIINKKGHMVTIPLNFVRCVRLAIPNDSNDINPDNMSLNRGRNTKIAAFEDDEDDEELEIDDTDEDDE